MAEPERREHAALQKSYFDRKVEYFMQPVPAEVERRTRAIVEAAGLAGGSRVLDVATGVGVLIPHILERGVKAGNLMGCDLSEQMLAGARARYPGVFFWLGDFLDFPRSLGPFDAIFFNACFGNFFDQRSVIDTAVHLADRGGRIVISHPMGSGFVAALHKSEPEIVPHLLPAEDKLSEWARDFRLQLETFRDEPDLYLAILRKSPQ